MIELKIKDMKSLIPKSHSRGQRYNSSLIQTMSVDPILRASPELGLSPGSIFSTVCSLEVCQFL